MTTPTAHMKKPSHQLQLAEGAVPTPDEEKNMTTVQPAADTVETGSIVHPSWCDPGACARLNPARLWEETGEYVHIRRYTPDAADYDLEPVYLTQSTSGGVAGPLELAVETDGLAASHARQLAALLLTIADVMDEATR